MVQNLEGRTLELAGVIRQKSLGALAGNGGGLIHYDYFVDSNLTLANGTSVTLLDGSTCLVFKTVTAMLTQFGTDGGSRTAWINSGNYNENITIPATAGGSSLVMRASGGNRTQIGTGLATALNINNMPTGGSGEPGLIFDGINWNGSHALGTRSVSGTVFNASATFLNCLFQGNVTADWAGATFINCVFADGYSTIDAAHTASTVYFFRCEMNFTCNFTRATSGHYFVQCTWGGVNDNITVTGAGSISGFWFLECTFDTSGANKTVITINTTGTASTVYIVGCNFGTPSVNGCIYFQAVAATDNIIVTNNNFPSAGAGLAWPILNSASANVTAVTFAHNSIGHTGAGEYSENHGTTTVTGNFNKSTFGPNVPEDIIAYNITGTRNTFYPPHDTLNLLWPHTAISTSTNPLTINIRAFTFRVNTIIVSVAATSIVLGAGVTSFIEVDLAGTVSANTVGYTQGRLPIGQVITNATNITSATEQNCLIATGGASRFIVRKAGDQGVTNSAVLVNDTALLAALLANKNYTFEVVVYYNAPTANDIAIAFTVPAGATLLWSAMALDTTVAGATGIVNAATQAASGTSNSYGGAGAPDVGMIIKGIVINGVNAGNLQLQFAEAVAGIGTTATIRANSYLVLEAI